MPPQYVGAQDAAPIATDRLLRYRFAHAHVLVYIIWVE